MSLYTGPSSVGRMGGVDPAGGTTPEVPTAILAGKLKRDIGDEIAWLEPSAGTMLRLLTPSEDKRGTIRKVKTTQQKFEFIEQRGNPRWGQIGAAGNFNQAATTLQLATGHAAYVQAGWLLYFPTTSNGVGGANGEVMQVVSRNTSADTIVVTRRIGNNPTGSYTVANSAYFMILGYTSAEGGNSPKIITPQETIPWNFVEIVKHAVGASNSQKAIQTYGPPDLTEQRTLKAIEHVVAIEKRLWFGRRGVATVASTEEEMATKFTGGIFQFLTTNYSSIATFSEAEFNTWLQTFFSYGSSEKAVFMSGWCIAKLNAFVAGKIRINDLLTKKYGMDISEWFSPFGTAYLIHNKEFINDFGKIGVGIDLKNIKYRYLRDTALEMNIQSNEADLEKDQYITEMGLELDLEETHSWFKCTA